MTFAEVFETSLRNDTAWDIFLPRGLFTDTVQSVTEIRNDSLQLLYPFLKR